MFQTSEVWKQHFKVSGNHGLQSLVDLRGFLNWALDVTQRRGGGPEMLNVFIFQGPKFMFIQNKYTVIQLI